MNEEALLTPKNKLIMFAVMASVCVAAWVTFKVIAKRELYKPRDYEKLVASEFHPSLPAGHDVLRALMKEARSYTDSDLSTYNIHITDKSRGSGAQLHTVIYEPDVPYDRTYQEFRTRFDNAKNEEEELNTVINTL